MRTASLYPPLNLKLPGEKIADLLDDFDWRRLPENPKFQYRGQRRKLMMVTFTDLGYASIKDHCDYYGKSLTTATMQALLVLGVHK